MLTFDPNCGLFHCTSEGILHLALIHAAIIAADIVQLKTSGQLDVGGANDIQDLHHSRNGVDLAPCCVGVWESADLTLQCGRLPWGKVQVAGWGRDLRVH